jgi:hypothetical protein
MNKLAWDIEKMGHEMRSPYNDGFTTFEIKKKLYEIKWAVLKQLDNSPNYVGEKEWLEEQETKNGKKEN